MPGQDRFFVFTIFLVVVLSIFHSGEALKCYNCNSAISPTCEIDPTSGEVVSCLDNNVCVSYNIVCLGKKVIIRSCGYRDFCKYTNPNVIQNCKECDTEQCKSWILTSTASTYSTRTGATSTYSTPTVTTTYNTTYSTTPISYNKYL
ncbi:uncharacterized protein LOC112454555 [Temnothorax curvispinosus]|uniref:Uncharacterized protein LOC112454555 n=1 Tax=Temnothorax curvispinosus TaxID=300111 RepID=A0A6J1PR51_9HYME|nr:uncharacterized protein LOC112454555 [Temnothorax curvispinosus]